MRQAELERLVRSAIDAHLGRVNPLQTIPESARAAVLVKPGQLELRRFPLRQPLEGEILIQVEACGICGTDVHCYNGDPFGLCPVVLGHEGTGIVVALGKNVREDSVGHPIKVGDRIVTSVMKVSDACVIAKYNPTKANLCDDLQVYGLLADEPDRPGEPGSGHHFNGYFGDYLMVRAGSTFFISNDLPLELRVLMEPAVVCVHALERSRRAAANLLNFRSRVIVQGCGPIGQLMIAAVRSAGVNNIIAIDGSPARLAMAKRMGADHLLNFKELGGNEGVVEAVNSLTKGLGAHFGFQCTGLPKAAANLFNLIRRGGGICEVGHFVDNGECQVNPHRDFCRKEITLVGSWVYNSFEYPNTYHFLAMARRIGLPLAELITHRFPLDRIGEAFETAKGQQGIKVMVEP
ncbi:MAG: zinc-binding dehydrogenase [Phycisphaerales bacterium]|jgi:L-iditol 2-dehydrogenase|nr:zinc-binding dehydrogenase [Phycisphaerales bacterium]